MYLRKVDFYLFSFYKYSARLLPEYPVLYVQRALYKNFDIIIIIIRAYYYWNWIITSEVGVRESSFKK